MVQIIKSNWWWGNWWGGGEWDMKRSVYDPNNVGKNVYDYTYFINKPTIPTKVSQLQNDSWFTSNTGTITSVKMNGTTVASSWEADLWTVITSHQNIKTVNSNSLVWTGNVSINETKVSATAPTSPTEWMVWYDTTNDVLKTYDGTTWNEVWSSGGSSALTTFILNDPEEQKTELYNWCRTFWGGDKVPVIISWDGGACYYWSMGYRDRDVFFNGTNVIEIIYERDATEVTGIHKFVWYPIDAKFYISSDLSDIASIWQEVADWLNNTSQYPTTTDYKDATVFVWDMPYYRVWSVIADGNNYVIAFYEDGTRIQNASSQTRTYRSEIRFTFSYTNGVWAYVSEAHSYIQIFTPYVLRTDYDYPTPYTPLYNGSPATKKYVDDSVSVVSGDSGTTYTIKVSNSDPASWTASNIITLVP